MKTVASQISKLSREVLIFIINTHLQKIQSELYLVVNVIVL